MSSEPGQLGERIAFDSFEVDLASGELFKNGRKIRLARQPADLLVLLATRSGTLVSREELRSALWPHDRFVDFDHGLNNCILRIREALRDSAQSSRFIETLPKKGYRFIPETRRLILPKADLVSQSQLTQRSAESTSQALPQSLVLENHNDRVLTEGQNASSRVVPTDDGQPTPKPAVVAAETVAEPQNPGVHESRSRRIPFAVATALLAVCIGVLTWLIPLNRSTDSSESETVPLTSLPGSENFPSFSPDGKQIAYVWVDDEDGISPSIYIKIIGSESQLRLTNSPGADFVPHWSPDGRYIAFCREAPGSTGVYIISALGGPERRIGTLDSCGNLDWLPDGQHLVVSNLIAAREWTPGNSYPLLLVDIDAGGRRPVTAPPMGTLGDASPLVSPDGTALAFVRLVAAEAADIYVMPLGGGASRRLTFDGQAKLGIAWTADSREIVFASRDQGSFRLWRIALRGGKPRPITSGGEDSYSPAVARQGNRLAYTVARNDINLWCIDISGSHAPRAGPPTRLISSNRGQTDAQFSPDSRKVAFQSGRSGPNEIWASDADGQGLQQLTHLGSYSGSPRWSPDGSQIAFDSRPQGNPDIFVIRADGGMPRRLTRSRAEDVLPNWSRDGKWIYFASNRTGEFQIWKVPAGTGVSTAVQVTRHGGYNAFESVDGKYLYFSKAPAKPGVWRRSLDGGNDSPEEPVLESVEQWSWWSLSHNGIYFFQTVEQPAQARHTTIALKFFNLQSRRTTQLALLHKPVGPLALSPDGRRLVYTQIDRRDRDLMLVENFR